jgi:hypothetical protein
MSAISIEHIGHFSSDERQVLSQLVHRDANGTIHIIDSLLDVVWSYTRSVFSMSNSVGNTEFPEHYWTFLAEKDDASQRFWERVPWISISRLLEYQIALSASTARQGNLH